MEQIQEQDERGSDGMKEAARGVDHLAIAGEPKKAFKKAGGFSIKPGPLYFVRNGARYVNRPVGIATIVETPKRRPVMRYLAICHPISPAR